MFAFCKYVLIWGLIYAVLLILDALILGGGHWANIAIMLVSSELFRLYLNMMNPGLDQRIAKNMGHRAASWQRNYIKETVRNDLASFGRVRF